MTTETKLSIADFKQALKKISPIVDHHRRILKAHYTAPNYTATATELANSVGYANYNAINLHYGIFVGLICESLGQPSNFGLIQTFHKPEGEIEQHLQLILRPEFVSALDELCWQWSL
jgi:hypothetical protein